MAKNANYVAFYLIGSALVFGASYLPISHKPVAALGVFQEPAKVALDLVLQMNTLIVSLNTAMFGAASALAVKGQEWSSRWSYFDGLLVMTALLAGAASYYGVYLCHTELLGMISAGSVNPNQAGVTLALALQYYATLLGFFLIGLLFTRMLGNRKK